MNMEVIVVGGGHAGCEAALTCAKLGHKTMLITSNINNIATMPCNPSIGGSAKGIVVREIDALGGIMGKIADKALLQMKMLNNKKGPAVRSLRSQTDKIIYPKLMLETLKNQDNLEIIEGMVEDLIIEINKVKGIILNNGTKINSKIVILTTGTYMKADILIGDTKKREGPHGEMPSLILSDKLKDLGFDILRLKTGTPPRLKKDSIDFSKIKREEGDKKAYTFSFDNLPNYIIEEQVPCYLTYTTPLTHEIIKKHLNKSSMYGGFFEELGVGARYCPSIEDKIVRFADKERHQLFIEPESTTLDEMYLQGFSTSMPYDVQDKMVKSLIGLENAIIVKYGYAIEYDAINPLNINPSLETKLVNNLFTAGQINGTSGYEEAACQGLMAGINASLKLRGKSPLIIKRNEGYIGVLIDDLVTKGVTDPYRLLTSRAEYRLLLRHDNADLRLRKYGYEVGLINDREYQELIQKEDDIKKLTNELKEIKLKIKENTKKVIELLKRPEITLEDLEKDYNLNLDYSDAVKEQVEINIKYEGYVKKVNKEASSMMKYEEQIIPEDINYLSIPNLASEARQKLDNVKPKSIGQAMRISGVNPADISILMIYLKRNYYGTKYF